MVKRRASKSISLAAKTLELALAAPQVVAHRTARMALAGPEPGAADRKEFALMINEKTAACWQAWIGMGWEAFRASQHLTAATMRLLSLPLALQAPATAVAAQVQNASVQVLAAGLAPVHRAALSNARRLAKARLR